MKIRNKGKVELISTELITEKNRQKLFNLCSNIIFNKHDCVDYYEIGNLLFASIYYNFPSEEPPKNFKDTYDILKSLPYKTCPNFVESKISLNKLNVLDSRLYKINNSSKENRLIFYIEYPISTIESFFYKRAYTVEEHKPKIVYSLKDFENSIILNTNIVKKGKLKEANDLINKLNNIEIDLQDCTILNPNMYIKPCLVSITERALNNIFIYSCKKGTLQFALQNDIIKCMKKYNESKI